jgi:uncharacterized protein (DUF2062 family)
MEQQLENNRRRWYRCNVSNQGNMVAIGVAIGVAMNNIPIGVALGIALFCIVDFVNRRRNG